MKKIYSLFILLNLLIFQYLKAQEAPVKISYQVKPDKSVEFDYRKTDPGSYTIVITFKNLTNCFEQPVQKRTIKHYSGRVLSLKPSDASQGIGFSYSYQYIRGITDVKLNNFVYLLPFKKGTTVIPYESTYMPTTYFGNTTPEDWKSYSFRTQKEDTVTAIRKGIVVDIKDEYTLDSLKSFAFKSKSNEIIIEHNDGTLARYSGFKKGSISVKLGETVFPQTALGVTSKYSADENSYALSLLIYYLKTADFPDQREKLNTQKSLYGFVTPLIYTDAGETILISNQQYVVGSTPLIISKEYSKKEIKQLSGN